MVSLLNMAFTFLGMLVYSKIIGILLKNRWSLLLKVVFQVCYIALLLPASIGLMETSLSLLIAGVGILFLIHNRPYGFAFLGVAVYLRLELIILLGILFTVFFIRDKINRLSIISFTALGLLPFIAYDLYFFHTVVPQSILAKSTVYSIEWFRTFIFVVFISLPDSILNKSFIGIVIVGTFFISLVVISGIITYKEWRLYKNIWPLVFYAWGLLIASGYILSHAFVFDWYIPLYTLPLLISIILCVYSDLASSKMMTRSLLTGIILISSLSVLGTVYSSIQRPSSFKLFEYGSRVKLYQRVGEMLYDAYPDADLLTSEIGGLGYAFQGRILDAAGLASPGSLKYHPMAVPDQRLSGGIGAIPPAYVKETFPQLIVSYDYFSQALREDGLLENYNVISIPAYLPEDEVYSESRTIWDNRFLRIYIRDDLPLKEQVFQFLR